MRSAARLSLVLMLVASVAAASCGRKLGPSELATLTTDTFTGTVGPGGIASHIFTVNYQVTYTDASIVITSLTGANGFVAPISVGVAFGSASGDTCTRGPSYSAVRAINQELRTIDVPFIAGPYCAQIFDHPDNPTITEPLNYTMVVTHY